MTGSTAAGASVGLEEGGPGQRARQGSLDRRVQPLTRGQARGELSRDHRPEDLATAFDSLVFGTITHGLYDDASEALELRMRRAAEVFLGGLETGKRAGTRRPRGAVKPRATRRRAG